MKLLIVTPYFYPKVGGLENYAYNFAQSLQKKYKWNIVVVTSNHKTKKDTKEKIGSLVVYRLAPLFKVSNTPINPLWYFKIKAIIRKEKPDIINAHTPVPFISDIAAFASGRIPFIVTYHAYSLYKKAISPLNVIVFLYKALEILQLKKARKIIVVSDAIKTAVPKEIKKKCTVIYNAISKKDIARAKKTDKKSLLFIGSLDKTHVWKGLDEVLHATKTLGESYTLHIVGDGDYKYFYEKLAQKLHLTKQVHFYGKRLGKEKTQLLKDAYIGIIYPTTRNDAFPTVALEYWANKTAIIASDSSPLNTILMHDKTALLVKPSKPTLLAEAIRKLSSDKKLHSLLVSNGLHELINKYLLENEVDKYYSVVHNAL